MGAQKATQTSSDLSNSPWGTSQHFVPTTRLACNLPLTIIISHNFQETTTVGDKLSNLISRIVALESCFDSRPSDVEEQRRRDDLIRCVTVPALLPICSFPPRKLEAINEQLPLFSEKSGLIRPADYVQASEVAFRLLEDIQEAILNYQVRLQPDALLDVDEGSRQCNRQCPTTKDSWQ